jgi:hypothetical protein
MVILGTPNYPVDSYRMMGLLIFGNTYDVSAEFETGKKEVNGFRKKYASFKDPILQHVQKYAVETELLQAVGRARLLNNNETQVLVLSGSPLNEADIVHYSEKTIIKRVDYIIVVDFLALNGKMLKEHYYQDSSKTDLVKN